MIIGLAASFTLASTNITLSADDTLWKTWRDSGIQAWQEGRLGIAEQLLVAAMEQAEKFGPEDLRVADTANDLAVVYATAGKILEAELLFRRSLAIGEKRLGADNPSVGTTIQNLGILKAMQQKYQEAEPLFMRALRINVQQFGRIHVRTAMTLKTLSTLYAVQGRMEEAERLIQTSLAILESAQVRQGDPQMTATLEVYAAILRNTNREREAREIEQHFDVGATAVQ
jgi:tetratricopeptide (TPR) repeat protein